MDYCYVGESFELSFEIKDPRDPERVPTEATFVVRKGDAVVQSGVMGIDGTRASFRFIAETAGMHSIEVAYSIGMDRWRAPFLLDVREIHRWRRATCPPSGSRRWG